MKFNGINVRISPKATIGENVQIGDGTTIYDNVVIDDNSVIANDCVIGEPTTAYYTASNTHENKPTVIGKNALIRSRQSFGADQGE